MSRTVHSKAPIRIDLAGGTLDIWPLYLLIENPLTINLAIDLCAEVELEETPCPENKAGIEFTSIDQNSKLEMSWKELEGSTRVPPQLELPWRLLRHYRKCKKHSEDESVMLKISTRAKSPAGAGLGGSSGLNIALTGALATWANGFQPPSVEEEGATLIELSKDIETQVLKVPAGLQDYYAAMFGGLQCLQWRPQSHSRSAFPGSSLTALEKRLVLFYSGQTRNSGINNWALYREFINGNRQVRDKFEEIGRATADLRSALVEMDWSEITRSIAREWEVRRTLADGITTREIDYAIETAQKMGCEAFKICGAGGGGCFFILLPSEDPELRERLVKKISASGIRALPFRGMPEGLHIRVHAG